MPYIGGANLNSNMHWDYRDQLMQTDLGGGGQAYYTYSASGQRVRKVWEKAPGLIEERIYLGGFELFRRHRTAIGSNTATLERETLHIMDDRQRIALVETRTVDKTGDDLAPAQLIRYQFGNYLGSASLELDDKARIISYEEYTPYGSTAYQAVRNQTEVPKRYRYTGKERDEESGLYYHGARYYAPWLGRWIGTDPAGLVDGPNLYQYSSNNPISCQDSTGFQTESKEETILLPYEGFTGKETVEELHRFTRERGFDFEGKPKWTGQCWDVGTLHQISRPKTQTGSQRSSGAEISVKGRETHSDISGEPSASSPVPSSENLTPLQRFGRGFLKGLAFGLVAGIAIAAMIASGGLLALAGGALAVGGAFMGGLAIGQVFTGESLSGHKLTTGQRAEMGGEVLGAVVGGAVAGGVVNRAVAKPSAPTESPISNDIIGKPRVGSGLKNDLPKTKGLPVENLGRQSVREFGPEAKQHGWSDIVDNYIGDATKFDLPDGAKLYQLEGSNQGRPGIFEWILNNGKVTHRRFIPGGRITGRPNQ